MSLRQLTQMAMLAAISIVLVFFVRLPFPAAPFLEYSPAEIPVIIAALLYGPGAGLVLTMVVAVVQGVTVSAHSGIIGIVMNILSTGSYVLVVGFFVHGFRGSGRGLGHRRGYGIGHGRPSRGVIIAMCGGIIATCAAMALWNIIFTPIFMGVPRDVVIGMILPVFLPFNLMRAGANSVIAFMAWRAVGHLLLKHTDQQKALRQAP